MSTYAQGNGTTRRISTPTKRAWEDQQTAHSQNHLDNTQNNSTTTTTKETTVNSMDSRPGGEIRLRSVELGVEDSNLQSVKMAKGDKNSPHNDNTNGELTVAIKNGSRSKEKDLERANNNDDDDEHTDDSFVGHWKLFTSVLKSKRFDSDKLESLYQRYLFCLNQKFTSWLVTILVILCVCLVAFQFSMEGTDHSKNIEGFIMIAFAVIYLILAFIVNRSGSSDKQMSDSSQKQLRWVSYALLLLSCGFVLSSVLCPIGDTTDGKYYSPTDGVWITIFFIYMTYTMLPVRMRIAVFGGCVLLTLHLVSSAFKNSENENLSRLVSLIHSLQLPLDILYWFCTQDYFVLVL